MKCICCSKFVPHQELFTMDGNKVCPLVCETIWNSKHRPLFTRQRLCPICEEGYLTDHVEMNELFHGIKSEMFYSTCDYCGSDQANAEQVNKNAKLARAAYMGYYYALGEVQPMPENIITDLLKVLPKG